MKMTQCPECKDDAFNLGMIIDSDTFKPFRYIICEVCGLIEIDIELAQDISATSTCIFGKFVNIYNKISLTDIRKISKGR